MINFFLEMDGGFFRNHGRFEPSIVETEDQVPGAEPPRPVKNYPVVLNHNKSAIFVSPKAGILYEVNHCLEWENALSVNPFPNKEEVDSNDVFVGDGRLGHDTLRHPLARVPIYDHRIPLNHRPMKNVHFSLERRYSFDFMSSLVLRHPLVKPFLGVILSLAKFKVGYSDEPYAARDGENYGADTFKAPDDYKKLGFGLGAIVGLNFPIKSNIDLLLFASYQIYNKMNHTFKRTNRAVGRDVIRSHTRDYDIKVVPKYCVFGAGIKVRLR